MNPLRTNTLTLNNTSITVTSGILAVSGVNVINANQTGSFVVTSQTGNFVTTSQTGIFATTSQTGAFYPITNPSGYVTTGQTGVFASTGWVDANYLNTGDLATGSGINISYNNTVATISTYLGNYYNSGAPLEVPISTVATFYNALSGNLGNNAGTYLTTVNLSIRTPPNLSGKLTSKFWNGSSTIWNASEMSFYNTGAALTGYYNVDYTNIVPFTGSQFCVVSVASSLTGCVIMSAPLDFATGIGSGTSTRWSIVRLA